MQEDKEVQEVVEVVNAAKLMTEVVTAAATEVIAVSILISAAKPAAKPKVLKIVPAASTVSTRKRKGVAAKRRRLREQAKEDENLKKQLEVVVDEDDDVLIEATPTGRKVPVVNYKIMMINNKPRKDQRKTLCVSAAREELTAAKHKLILLV
nr:hypothetical protein [Tanacetum cinerariifolium]